MNKGTKKVVKGKAAAKAESESEDLDSSFISLSSEEEIVEAKPKATGKRPQPEPAKNKVATSKKPVAKESKKETKKEAKKVTKAQDKKAAKADSDEEDEPVKLIATKKPKVDLTAHKPVAKKGKKEEDEPSDINISDEESAPMKDVKKEPIKPKAAPKKAAPVKLAATNLKLKKEVKKQPTKEESESSVDISDISDEEEKPVAKAKAKVKKPSKPVVEEDAEEEQEEAPEEEEAEPEAEENKEEAEEEVEGEAEGEAEEEAEEEAEAESDEKEQKQEEQGETELFIGNLPYSATEEDISAFFGSYGPVESVQINMKDGRSSGSCFLRFKKAESAEAAHEEKNLDFQGRSLRVRYRSAEPPKNFTPRNTSGGNTIFVGSLSYNSTQESVATFFQECGNVMQVRIATDPSGNPRGFAHVEFDTPDAVSNALTLTGQRLDGRAIRIDAAASKERNSGNTGGRFPQRGNQESFGGQERRGPPRNAPAFGIPGKNKATIQPFQGKKTRL